MSEVIKYPNDAPAPSLVAVVAERASSTPNRTFLRDVDGNAATYAQSYRRAGCWTTVLRSVGVSPGDRVITMVPNSVESVQLWMGIAGCGAIETPVHPAFKSGLLEHAVNAVEAQVVIITADALPRFIASLPRLTRVTHLLVLGTIAGVDAGDVHVFDAEAQLDDARPATSREVAPFHYPSVILYTSGTTGPSKPVIVPWGQLQVSAQGALPYDDLDETDVLYVYFPPSHIGAKQWTYLAALIGGSVLLRTSFKTDEFLDDVRRYGITSAGLIGAMAHFLQGQPEAAADRDIPLRNIVMGPLLPDLDAFKERFGVRVHTCFGMTELSVPIRADGWSTNNPAAAGKRWMGWPYFETRLVDEHDREVAVGETGELMVRVGVPWTITPGYFGMPEATAEAWRNGWFHTGDVFRTDAEGYFYFVDRGKDCIRRRAENISSFEVEAAALTHPDVADAAAVGVPADTNEEEIKLFLVAKPGVLVDPVSIINHLNEQLPKFMVPRYIELIDELPKTPTMRTQKHLLRNRPLDENTWDRSSRQLPQRTGRT